MSPVVVEPMVQNGGGSDTAKAGPVPVDIAIAIDAIIATIAVVIITSS